MSAQPDREPLSREDLISYAIRHPFDAVCLVLVFALGLALVIKAAGAIG